MDYVSWLLCFQTIHANYKAYIHLRLSLIMARLLIRRAFRDITVQALNTNNLTLWKHTCHAVNSPWLVAW